MRVLTKELMQDHLYIYRNDMLNMKNLEQFGRYITTKENFKIKTSTYQNNKRSSLNQNKLGTK